VGIATTFETFGSIKEIRPQNDRRKGGFLGSVFIEYYHPSSARLAKLQMDGQIVGNQPITVDFAKERIPPKKKAKLDHVEKPPSNSNPPPSRSLYVGGLPFNGGVSLIHDIFGKFGRIVDIRILKHPSGRPKGVAFVDYELMESASKAIEEMDNQICEGRTLKVNYASNPSKELTTDLKESRRNTEYVSKKRQPRDFNDNSANPKRRRVNKERGEESRPHETLNDTPTNFEGKEQMSVSEKGTQTHMSIEGKEEADSYVNNRSG
jgi:RNA recognition motif-containing protein